MIVLLLTLNLIGVAVIYRKLCKGPSFQIKGEALPPLFEKYGRPKPTK
jgi:hypothetical protein